MARLRVRFRFNPGRHGAPQDRLGEFSIQIEKFLRSLCNDLGINAKKGEWIAEKFSDGSVGWDSIYGQPVSPNAAVKNYAALNLITSGSPLDAVNHGLVSYGTMTEFSRIGETMSPDEHFIIGLFNDEATQEPELREVAYGQTAEVRRLLSAPYVSLGSVQGIMHSWVMEGQAKSFTIRELASGALVKCFYEKEIYKKVHEATERPNCVVTVYGQMEWDRATNAIVSIDANDVDVAVPLSEAEFEGLFGSAPNYVGTMTSAEYIEWLRGDSE
jgi:hypothetical protein